MRLTPMDINNKEFKRGLRGYNPDEVDEFLDKIVEEYEAIYKENSLLKEKVSSINEKVDHYTKIENTIQNTLLLAQNASEQARANAQKEADMVIKNANETAQKIIDKAHNDVVSINDEYDKVRQEFIKFRAKYRNFINAQMETFEDLEKDLVKNYNIGELVQEDIEEKEIQEQDKNEYIEEDNLHNDDLNTIKSFFANK
ncbi:cell division initiation protein [Clostridium amylolyticum]|uniref:Cell division initiation protein n=1 Tax=Clostridium amylolyticum TaxID=1121298 RepID=A0A1M6KK24_9CLOT|nr:DivIVA domain-containing protein [Clostridium amylolyticum]SHJ59269.1 cell division initiation protein [Clostridium amylolyticum]